MDDRTLLELAAKAAGITLRYNYLGTQNANDPWLPLTDDGDALRLAVTLGISITPYPIYNSEERHSVIAKQRRRSDTMRENNPTEVMEIYGADRFSATRRAIVRSAAAIGEQMK